MRASRSVGHGAFACLCLAAGVARAEPTTNLRHPLPAGLIDPSFFFAGATNPAALVKDKVVGFEDLYAPAKFGNTAQMDQLGLAASNGSLAVGAGYEFQAANQAAAAGSQVSSPGQSAAQHSMFAGVGLKVGDVGLGYGLSTPFLNQSINPDMKLAFLLGVDSRVSYAFVLEHLNGGAPQLHLGVGYEKENQYNFELNLLLPPFAGLAQSGSAYTFTFAAAVYSTWFGMSFRAVYPYILGQATSQLNVSHSVGVLAWIAKNWNITLLVDTSNVLSLGLTGAF